MNIDELKNRAIALEAALQANKDKSPDIFSLLSYAPVVSAISRAKDMQITQPEELPSAGYWVFETEIQSFPEVELAFSRFHLMLRGLDA